MCFGLFSGSEVSWRGKPCACVMELFHPPAQGAGGQHSTCGVFSGSDPCYLLSAEPENCLGECDLLHAKTIGD